MSKFWAGSTYLAKTNGGEERAELLLGEHAIELWHGDVLLERFNPMQ